MLTIIHCTASTRRVYAIAIVYMLYSALFCFIVCSFHVGSAPDGLGVKDPEIYQSAIRMSTVLFEYASNIGYNLSLLDIGGGYPGHSGSEPVFYHVSDGINDSLTKFKSAFPAAEIISEPGNCFMCVANTSI